MPSSSALPAEPGNSPSKRTTVAQLKRGGSTMSRQRRRQIQSALWLRQQDDDGANGRPEPRTAPTTPELPRKKSFLATLFGSTKKDHASGTAASSKNKSSTLPAAVVAPATVPLPRPNSRHSSPMSDKENEQALDGSFLVFRCLFVCVAFLRSFCF